METAFILLQKITRLAVERQLPFIILENPRRVAASVESPHSPSMWPDTLMATIGNVAVSFDGYNMPELIDLYAELKAGLEAEDTYKKAHAVGFDAAKQAYAKGP